MARKKKHEEHANHEAWAIPYGDLVTLLLALFVVMYAMSSVNEGKFRVLSDALVAAFQGSPKTVTPINIGTSAKGEAPKKSTPSTQVNLSDPRMTMEDKSNIAPELTLELQHKIEQAKGEAQALNKIADDIREALQGLIDKKLVVVRREPLWLEVEIRTDILFPSGVADIASGAAPILEQLAGILKPFPNPVRVEGHTDNVPISTRAFPSNWELSAARAASVVHLFTKAGMNPQRLEIIGLGEFRPITSNATVEGRNTNRRVRIVILERNKAADETSPDDGGATPQSRAAAAAANPVPAAIDPASAPAAQAPAAPARQPASPVPNK